jgi:hypothetical protein
MPGIPYEEDDDSNTDPNGTQGAKREAFEVPKGGKLIWRGVKDPGPAWRPYVIKAELASGQSGIDEPYLRFRFLKDTGDFGEMVHCIDLNDRRLVWRRLPSTLRNLSPAKPCAFLFLTEDLERIAPVLYQDGNVNGKRGIAILEGGTGGTGKWPIGAGFLVGAVGKLVDGAKGVAALSPEERRAIEELLGRTL